MAPCLAYYATKLPRTMPSAADAVDSVVLTGQCIISQQRILGTLRAAA